MNARSLANRLREMMPKLALIVMSGWDRDTLLSQQAIERDDELLGKPFTLPQLRNSVERVINSKSRGDAATAD
jgi:hypothetical protein